MLKDGRYLFGTHFVSRSINKAIFNSGFDDARSILKRIRYKERSEKII